MKAKFMKKKAAAIAAMLLAVALLATGTFAYLAGQGALNLFFNSRVPEGGVGRDDFVEGGDGNKDVFVENKGVIPLYARIKLEEFLELTRKNQDTETIVGGENATRTPSEDWVVHKTAPGEDGVLPAGTALGEGNGGADAHSYWKWTMGGEKVYLPAPEDAIPADQTQDGVTHTNSAHNDADDYSEYLNDAAGQAALGLKQTPNATVITYAQWVADYARAPGPYWIITASGWMYWGQPIAPGDATGLLLDAVELNEALLPEDWEDYYYAINVLFDFWDKNSWGVVRDDDNLGEDEEDILDGIEETEPVEYAASGPLTVYPGQQNLPFTATADGEPTGDVEWTLHGASSTGTQIGLTSGLLNVGSNEVLGTEFTITAAFPDGTTQTLTVTVVTEPIVEPRVITITGPATVEKGDTGTYSATVNVGDLDDLEWEVTGGSDSSITAGGVLSVGEDETAETLTVVATLPDGTTAEFTVTVGDDSIPTHDDNNDGDGYLQREYDYDAGEDWQSDGRTKIVFDIPGERLYYMWAATPDTENCPQQQPGLDSWSWGYFDLNAIFNITDFEGLKISDSDPNKGNVTLDLEAEMLYISGILPSFGQVGEAYDAEGSMDGAENVTYTHTITLSFEQEVETAEGTKTKTAQIKLVLGYLAAIEYEIDE